MCGLKKHMQKYAGGTPLWPTDASQLIPHGLEELTKGYIASFWLLIHSHVRFQNALHFVNKPIAICGRSISWYGTAVPRLHKYLAHAYFQAFSSQLPKGDSHHYDVYQEAGPSNADLCLKSHGSTQSPCDLRAISAEQVMIGDVYDEFLGIADTAIHDAIQGIKHTAHDTVKHTKEMISKQTDELIQHPAFHDYQLTQDILTLQRTNICSSGGSFGDL
ncbi:hypothetical protein DAEQUDRAFT_742148, partial [Daedalea quercina L-15889]